MKEEIKKKKEIEFKVKSEKRKMVCHKCLTIVTGKIFFMEMMGTFTHFIYPTTVKPFICDNCKNAD